MATNIAAKRVRRAAQRRRMVAYMATMDAASAESTTPAAGSPLRYSSPWPWIRALAIGTALWSGILWLVWHFVA
jgi:hypothetical protein